MTPDTLPTCLSSISIKSSLKLVQHDLSLQVGIHRHELLCANCSRKATTGNSVLVFSGEHVPLKKSSNNLQPSGPVSGTTCSLAKQPPFRSPIILTLGNVRSNRGTHVSSSQNQPVNLVLLLHTDMIADLRCIFELTPSDVCAFT
jgi:hypothetical protein